MMQPTTSRRKIDYNLKQLIVIDQTMGDTKQRSNKDITVSVIKIQSNKWSNEISH